MILNDVEKIYQCNSTHDPLRNDSERCRKNISM